MARDNLYSENHTMHYEDTLTTILAAFRTIGRDEFGPDVANARETARETLLGLAAWIEKGGAPPKILLDGSELVRYPVDLR